MSLFSLLLIAPTAGSEEVPKPNIIFLLADDQRNDALGCYGNDIIETPTLDRLAAEGVRFQNGFCEVPICAASRATIFTGVSQRSHGYNFGEPPVAAHHAQISYPTVLKKQGYRTGFVGKFGVRFAEQMIKKNFDFFRAINRNPYLKQMLDGSQRHETDLCADAAIEFIESTPKKMPFCLSVSFNATHAEDGDLRPGKHFQWPESSDGMYDAVKIPLPRLYDAKYNEALPPFLRGEANLNTKRFYWRWNTPEKYQTNIRAYYRMLTGIDHAIARLLTTIQDHGLAENTIIVYSADNGFMMGDRRTAGKWNHYEQSLRVPLIVYDPTLHTSKRGRVIDEMVSLMDIAPTFIDYAGLTIPDAYQGSSMVPLIHGKPPTVDWRDSLYVEHKFKHFNNWRGIRTAKYKYAIYYDEPDGPYECLYDLEKDPDELINLARNPEYDSVLEDMQLRLNQKMKSFPERSK